MGQVDTVFQVDSEIVKTIYESNKNYLIEYDKYNEKSNICAIYFCSNDIYYPNTEEVFRKRIVEQNFFEWYRCRINRAKKHIFVRDIFKQWYLQGINSEINTPQKLLELLKNETEGYDLVTVGSSAGGYAAILYGSCLNAMLIIASNPQIELYSRLKESEEKWDPLVFKLASNKEYEQFYNIKNRINPSSLIYYLYSNKSRWDQIQYELVKSIPSVRIISFNTKHHGIPFLKVALEKTINSSVDELLKLSNSKHSPVGYTISQIGIWKTICGLLFQIKIRMNRYKNEFVKYMKQ